MPNFWPSTTNTSTSPSVPAVLPLAPSDVLLSTPTDTLSLYTTLSPSLSLSPPSIFIFPPLSFSLVRFVPTASERRFIWCHCHSVDVYCTTGALFSLCRCDLPNGFERRPVVTGQDVRWVSPGPGLGTGWPHSWLTCTMYLVVGFVGPTSVAVALVERQPKTSVRIKTTVPLIRVCWPAETVVCGHREARRLDRNDRQWICASSNGRKVDLIFSDCRSNRFS